MKVIIFFTYGISLNDWKRSGLLEREVELYNHLSNTYNIKFSFITYGDTTDLEVLPKSSNIEVIPIYKYFNKNNNKYFEFIKSFTYFLKLKKIITIDKSILKTNQLWGSWIPILIKLTSGNRLIIRTGYDLLNFKRKEGVSKLKLVFYRLLTKYSLHFSDIYLVTSKSDRNNLIKEFPKNKAKTHKLSNWVNVPDYLFEQRYTRKLVSVGRLETQKNFGHLIESFENSDFEIDIIGLGSKKEELVSLAKKQKTKVNFLGKITNKELINMLPKYKYFITSTFYEGNPKAILEAMAAGCIVIAPDVEGVRELIQNEVNGILYNLEQDNLIKILENINTSKEREISNNAIKTINSEHLLEVVAKKEFDIYKIISNY